MASKIRLYVDHPLREGQSVPLTRDQAHYLFGVMRLQAGAVLSLINGHDGEWDAVVAEAGKKGGVLVCEQQTAPLQMPRDLWLLFAPIRKDRMAFLVEKAVELGVARLLPVQTAYTNHADRLRMDRLRAQVVEATEQCGATYVPEVAEPEKLAAVLKNWDAARALLFCDEAARGEATDFGRDAPAALLIGPEGGFASQERDMLRAHQASTTVSLGPRILRSETAALAALTLWQSRHGDWQ